MERIDEKKDESDEEFQCRAINHHYATSTDELDLKAGETYTIIQTSAGRWMRTIKLSRNNDKWKIHDDAFSTIKSTG